MASVVTGSPLIAFADALYSVLGADAKLPMLARNGTVAVLAAVPRESRTAFPYVVVGRRELKGSGFAMQVSGGEGGVFVDVWSDFNGPEEAQDIQARIRAIVLRDPTDAVAQRMLLGNARMIADSLTIEDEKVFEDFDADMPKRSRFHGVQFVSADLEETS